MSSPTPASFVLPLAVAALALTPTAPAQLDFDGQPVTAAAAGVRDVQSGDVDGDGDADVVFSDINGIHWSENLDGAGSFAAPAVLVTRIGMSTNLDVAVADMDGDGDLDLAGVEYDANFSEYAFSWHANDGAGSFGATETITLIYEFTVLFELADIDADGDDDVVLSPFAYYDPRDIDLLRNDGAGVFTPIGSADVPTGDTYFTVQALTAGDVDGDGDVDLALTAERLPFPHFNHNYVIQWLENTDGLGSYVAAEILHVASASAGEITSIAIADLDADGDADVLTGGANFALSWFAQEAGTGEFDVRQSLSVSAIEDVDAADMDHDGDVDIVIAAGTTLWLENIAGPGFNAVATLDPTSVAADRAVLADMDGDADLDVIASSQGAGAIDWLQSELELLPWPEVGAGLAGGAGLPTLDALGVLADGQLVSFDVNQAPANAPIYLILGLSQLLAPFKGGTLAPSPDIIIEGLLTDPTGALLIATPWPDNVPAGVTITLQAWFQDATGPLGFTATNGVARVTQ